MHNFRPGRDGRLAVLPEPQETCARMPGIGREAAIIALNRGELPCSAGESSILELASPLGSR